MSRIFVQPRDDNSLPAIYARLSTKPQALYQAAGALSGRRLFTKPQALCSESAPEQQR
ncbi:MAG: hypothetical protein ACR2PJ_02925 [Pseudomonadales bacterium]